MLDLDGVVYIGSEAVAGVPDRLAEAASQGMALAFVTNNAARTPAEVAQQLRDIGVDARETDVVTSAQAAAALLTDRVPAGSRVLVAGGEGLVAALEERGLVAVSAADDRPAAVVQGFHPTVGWRLLAEASYAIAAGLPWIASNLDLTVPTSRGIAPGNGSLVNAVASAVGRRPDAVAGKPYRPLFDETVRRTGAARPLVVGDRLDTDIEGAANCDAHSLLVLTGVTTVADLCAAPERQRPDYVSLTLTGLLTPHAAPEPASSGAWSLNGWRVAVDDGAVQVQDRGADLNDGLRAAVEASWQWRDATPDAPLDTHALAAVLSGDS
jgi:HAD superfamily hydrolase (TIGR01450 family)